jgi:hypothetical protein
MMRHNLFLSDYRWRRLVILFASTLLVLSFFVTASYGEPVQWSGNGHYYEIVATEGCWIWSAARDYASTQSFMGLQGYLGTITSYEEQKFIQTLSIPDDCTIWIGGFQPSGSSEPDGNWQWLTGETFVWADYDSNGWGWNGGEPNNAGGNENCMEYNYFNNGNWNDVPCDETNNCCILIEYGEKSQPIPTMNRSGILILSVFIAASVMWLMRRRKRTT